MVQILNLKSVGALVYSRTIENLKTFIDFINSQYAENQKLQIQYEQENNDKIAINKNDNSQIIWNFLIYFNRYNEGFEIKSEKITGQTIQNVLITDSLNVKNNDFEVIISSKKNNICELLIDYMFVFDNYGLANNCDLNDFFNLSSGKQLYYNKIIYNDLDFNEKINEYFKNKAICQNIKICILNTTSTIELNIDKLEKIIEQVQCTNIKADTVFNIFKRQKNWIGILTEK